MALVINKLKHVDIPHEPGEWMELKKLSWKQLEKASDIATDATMDRMKKIGGDLLVALRDSAKEQEQDPNAKYDRTTVLCMGIAKWSYPEDVTPENIDELDDETAEWAFREILLMNKPRTPEETKNA